MTNISHTEKLQRQLSGFELYILSHMEKVMNDERIDHHDYGTDITYYDDLESFYSWFDSLSHVELTTLIEEYATERASVRTYSIPTTSTQMLRVYN